MRVTKESALAEAKALAQSLGAGWRPVVCDVVGWHWQVVKGDIHMGYRPETLNYEATLFNRGDHPSVLTIEGTLCQAFSHTPQVALSKLLVIVQEAFLRLQARKGIIEDMHYELSREVSRHKLKKAPKRRMNSKTCSEN